MVTISNVNKIQLFMCEISRKYKTVMKNRHKYPILAQSQGIFYVHKASMMADHCTQQNTKIHLRYITTDTKFIK